MAKENTNKAMELVNVINGNEKFQKLVFVGLTPAYTIPTKLFDKRANKNVLKKAINDGVSIALDADVKERTVELLLKTLTEKEDTTYSDLIQNLVVAEEFSETRDSVLSELTGIDKLSNSDKHTLSAIVILRNLFEDLVCSDGLDVGIYEVILTGLVENNELVVENNDIKFAKKEDIPVLEGEVVEEKTSKEEVKMNNSISEEKEEKKTSKKKDKKEKAEEEEVVVELPVERRKKQKEEFKEIINEMLKKFVDEGSVQKEVLDKVKGDKTITELTEKLIDRFCEDDIQKIISTKTVMDKDGVSMKLTKEDTEIIKKELSPMIVELLNKVLAIFDTDKMLEDIESDCLEIDGRLDMIGDAYYEELVMNHYDPIVSTYKKDGHEFRDVYKIGIMSYLVNNHLDLLKEFTGSYRKLDMAIDEKVMMETAETNVIMFVLKHETGNFVDSLLTNLLMDKDKTLNKLAMSIIKSEAKRRKDHPEEEEFSIEDFERENEKFMNDIIQRIRNLPSPFMSKVFNK